MMDTLSCGCVIEKICCQVCTWSTRMNTLCDEPMKHASERSWIGKFNPYDPKPCDAHRDARFGFVTITLTEIIGFPGYKVVKV